MDKTNIVVSVPGKIHFLGEHVVVYGKPALIAAIGKRCRITLTPRSDSTIEIVARSFNKAAVYPISDVVSLAQRAREDWRKFIDTKDVSFLTKITKDLLDYPFLAVGETLQFYNTTEKEGFKIEIDSEIPVGAGCGSSSAVAVGISAAISKFLGYEIDREKIFQLAVRIEELKHGTPSGGDPATVLYGGIVWFQKNPDGTKTITPLDVVIDPKLAANFYLIDSGKPEETTGEMIAIVREKLEKNPEETNQIFAQQEQLVHELLEALKHNNRALMIRIITAGERNLETLGAVSPFVQGLIRSIEKSGGAAKISGGGGKTIGTGMLLVYHPKKDKLKSVLLQYDLPFLQVPLAAPGLIME